MKPHQLLLTIVCIMELSIFVVSTTSPTAIPTSRPSFRPSILPSIIPSLVPSKSPSIVPTSIKPSNVPSLVPTKLPSANPSITPSIKPSLNPSNVPTYSPSIIPTLLPTISPSKNPSQVPTLSPTMVPTNLPTLDPSAEPSITPTEAPSLDPTVAPTTSVPSIHPSASPSSAPKSNFIVNGIPNIIFIAVVALGGSLCMLAIMAVAFLRFYRKRGEEVDDSDEYGKALSSRSSRYPLETFDLQALYRSVIVDSADSEQTSKRGSGHSVSAVATSSGRPSLPPLRSTSRTRSTISPAESPDNEDTQNWTDSELAPGSTASVSASYYEDEDRVYYHGGEAYTVTERVLRTSGKSSSQSTLPSRTEDKRRARRSSRKDLLFEPVGTEIGICNTNMNDDETEPLVNSTAKDNTTFRPNGTNEADHGPTSTSLSRRSDSSSCDTVPEPAPIVRSSAKSVPEYDQCNVDDAVYVSSRASMK